MRCQYYWFVRDNDPTKSFRDSFIRVDCQNEATELYSSSIADKFKHNNLCEKCLKMAKTQDFVVEHFGS